MILKFFTFHSSPLQEAHLTLRSERTSRHGAVHLICLFWRIIRLALARIERTIRIRATLQIIRAEFAQLFTIRHALLSGSIERIARSRIA